MKKLILLCLICLSNFVCSGQKINISLIDSISFTKNKFQNFIAVDNHDSYYFSNFEVITKISNDQNWVYANYQLGVPTSISVINPLQVLVFYKETNTIVFLDRFLNETLRLNLSELTPPKISWWVGNTKNQEIWIYNGETNQLEFYNYKQNTTLSQAIPFLESPLNLTSNFNTSFVLFEDKINQYNIYGTLLHSIPIENIKELKVSNSYLLGKSENQFQLFTTNLKSIGNFKISKNNISDFSLRNEKLYIYIESILYIYKFTLPSK